MACRPVSRHGGTVLRGLTIEASPWKGRGLRQGVLNFLLTSLGVSLCL